ncbi:hypothetical protein A2U01_0067924, partial [Trifolium medium]|nr:hypothetical protein [Trifolium medium]
KLVLELPPTRGVTCAAQGTIRVCVWRFWAGVHARRGLACARHSLLV